MLQSTSTDITWCGLDPVSGVYADCGRSFEDVFLGILSLFGIAVFILSLLILILAFIIRKNKK
jgi:hypothetical protein